MDRNNPAAMVQCWVELYTDELYTWAFYKTNKKETAEDLVQDTFLAAYQGFDRFSGKSEVKTWLFSILHNKIAEHYRKQYKNPAANTGTDLSYFFEPDGEWKKEERPQAWDTDAALLDDPAFTSVLNKCMDQLPAHWNAAMKLKYLEDKKGELICQELEITPSNFWQVLHRAKLQLRKCLELHWFKNK